MKARFAMLSVYCNKNYCIEKSLACEMLLHADFSPTKANASVPITDPTFVCMQHVGRGR